MKLIEIQSEIGFADGEILRCERIGSAFVVRVRAWNSKNLRLENNLPLITNDKELIKAVRALGGTTR